jgi:hypothetical protein
VEKWCREIFRISDNFEDLKVPNEEEFKSKKPEPQEAKSDTYKSIDEKLHQLNKFKVDSIQHRHFQTKRTRIKWLGTCKHHRLLVITDSPDKVLNKMQYTVICSIQIQSSSFKFSIRFNIIHIT